MSDGCWVQFWDDDNCNGATLRFDAEGGSRTVNNLDDYLQSDGSKEGNEPDSLETGSRSWLVVYKDDNYEGRNAMFGPNSQINDLDVYGMGGNISSFKLYDDRPSWFVESTKGNPSAIETDDDIVNSQTVNNYFRTFVAAGLSLIPVVGGALSSLVSGLWPDTNNRDQAWACFQNYLNQAIAGVYWQLEYGSLNSALTSLWEAAKDYVNIPEEDHEFKVKSFSNLYDLVNNLEPFFVDEQTPEKKYSFLVPFATLRLATLRENLQHYSYYNGSEPSDELRRQLTEEIQHSIDLYQTLLKNARDRILTSRKNQVIISAEGLATQYFLIDLYSGYREKLDDDDRTYRKDQYVDGLLNQLALTLDFHNTVGQLWNYFDPSVTGPVLPPTLSYAKGPYGWYQNVEQFSQMAGDGKVAGVTLWTASLVDALELIVNDVPQGRIGGPGGSPQTLALDQDERIMSANGTQTGLIKALGFTTNTGRSIYGGTDDPYRRFDVQPLAGSLDTRLAGLTGYAGVGSAGDDNVKALTFHWRCELPLDQAEVGEA